MRRGSAGPREAARALLAELSATERLWLLDGDAPRWRGLFALARRYNAEPAVGGAVPRLGIPGIRFTDGPRGVVMGASTAFPVAVARGASWDPELEEEIGRAIGREARAQGANLFAGVCVNLLRHPAWGRAQETYGEDPVLLGEMGAALTRGARENVMACVKHFALNSIEEARFVVDVGVDEETLHEVYLPHFKRVIDAGAEAVMSAYNSVNGSWAGESRALLTEILREEWGFEGFVISDFIWGLRDAVASVRAGLDIEMPLRQQRARELPGALADGRLEPDDVDRAGERILATQLRHSAGLGPAPEPGVVACAAHRRLARRAATRGMVLLRNRAPGGRPALPLDPTATRRLAVIGRLATAANLGDAGSSAVRPPSTVPPLQGLRAAFPAATVDHSDGSDPAAAAAAAAEADAAVVLAGYGARDEGEAMVALDADAVGLIGPPLDGRLARAVVPRLLRLGASSLFPGGDRRSLTLRPADEELIRDVAAANPLTVVVVIGGSAVIMESWRRQVAAILIAWYPGMEGGHAIADVLTGAAEPGGRLPMAIPASAAHLPFFDPTARSIAYDRWWGQRKLDRDGNEAAYPLGFGLGYTELGIAGIGLAGPRPGPDEGGDGLLAHVTVFNSGPRRGATIAQLYGVREDPSSADRPRRELLGFARVELDPGERGRVAVRGSLRPLARRDPATRRWTVPPGRYAIEAARYSGDPEAPAAPLRIDPPGHGLR